MIIFIIIFIIIFMIIFIFILLLLFSLLFSLLLSLNLLLLINLWLFRIFVESSRTTVQVTLSHLWGDCFELEIFFTFHYAKVRQNFSIIRCNTGILINDLLYLFRHRFPVVKR